MNGVSQRSEQKTLEDIPSVIFLQVSVAGATPCESQDGATAAPFGPEVAHASHLARQESKKEPKTSGICGPSSSGSSASVNLQSSLENKLRQLLGTDGSMEYSQTWRRKATPAGRQYWAHTASAHRISDNASTGWPTA